MHAEHCGIKHLDMVADDLQDDDAEREQKRAPPRQNSAVAAVGEKKREGELGCKQQGKPGWNEIGNQIEKVRRVRLSDSCGMTSLLERIWV